MKPPRQSVNHLVSSRGTRVKTPPIPVPGTNSPGQNDFYLRSRNGLSRSLLLTVTKREGREGGVVAKLTSIGGGIYQLEGMERRLTVHGMMDTLNRGSSKRGLAFWTPARDHSVADIYALLMHRKHFASIAVTMDLIVYRRVNLQTTRFQHRNLHSFSPQTRSPVRSLRQLLFSVVHVHPPEPSSLFSNPRVSVSPHTPLPLLELWPTARMFLLTVLYN